MCYGLFVLCRGFGGRIGGIVRRYAFERDLLILFGGHGFLFRQRMIGD